MALPRDEATSPNSLTQTRLNDSSKSSSIETRHHDIIVAGSLASDTIADYTPFEKHGSDIQPVLQTSNPSHITQSPGGVGRNVATAAHHTGSSTLLASAVVDDIAGSNLLTSLTASGMSTSGISILPSSAENPARTAQYLAINDTNKDLHLAMSDMSILEHPSSPLSSPSHWRTLLTTTSPKWLILDTNFPTTTLSTILSSTTSLPHPPKIAIEPVSTAKSARLVPLFSTPPFPKIDLLTPNTHELTALYSAFHSASLLSTSPSDSPWFRTINALSLPSTGSRSAFVRIAGPELTDQGIPQQSIQLLPYFPCILTKLGPKGCLLTRIIRPDEVVLLQDAKEAKWILSRADRTQEAEELVIAGVYMRRFLPAENIEEGEVVSVNGAGDTLVGTLVAELAKKGGKMEDGVEKGQRAAVEVLKGGKIGGRRV
ncbi:MAG: hypothetical protein Q9227_006682 [Pyrenula ochraceoflavens]